MLHELIFEINYFCEPYLTSKFLYEMNRTTILKYLKYKMFSHHRKGHGIHSPFVFDLVSNVFRNKIDPLIVLDIEKVRKKMLSERRIVEINDLGAGSVRNNSNYRKVSEIARNSAVPKKYGAILHNMALSFGAPYIVELGTSLGISTMYLASAGRNIPVYTVEGCKTISSLAAENFNESGFTNISLYNRSFEEFMPGLTSFSGSPGLVFIDGNHRKEPVLNYFSRFAEIAGEKTVVILDDIHSSEEMEEAWRIIKSDGRVRFSIDIFRMGMLFFRGGTNHCDYVVRY